MQFAFQDSLVSLQKNVQFLLAAQEAKQNKLPPIPKKQQSREIVKSGIPHFYNDRILGSEQELKLTMGVEKVFEKKQLKPNLDKYYKTKEEIYKKFIFNDNPTQIEKKFQVKQDQVQEERAQKDIEEKTKVNNFLSKLKRLENPFINSLFSEPKLSVREKSVTLKAKKIQLSLSEIKDTLDDLDKKEFSIQNSLKKMNVTQPDTKTYASVLKKPTLQKQVFLSPLPFKETPRSSNGKPEQNTIDLQKQYMSKSLSTIRSRQQSEHNSSQQIQDIINEAPVYNFQQQPVNANKPPSSGLFKIRNELRSIRQEMVQSSQVESTFEKMHQQSLQSLQSQSVSSIKEDQVSVDQLSLFKFLSGEQLPVEEVHVTPDLGGKQRCMPPIPKRNETPLRMADSIGTKTMKDMHDTQYTNQTRKIKLEDTGSYFSKAQTRYPIVESMTQIVNDNDYKILQSKQQSSSIQTTEQMPQQIQVNTKPYMKIIAQTNNSQSSMYGTPMVFNQRGLGENSEEILNMINQDNGTQDSYHKMATGKEIQESNHHFPPMKVKNKLTL